MCERNWDSSSTKYVEGTRKEDVVQLQWDMAIGLQEVDDLKLSKYFEKLVDNNVNGKFNNRTGRKEINYNELECDFVTTRMVELLDKDDFVLLVDYLKYVYKYLFQDVYEFAGEFRKINFLKQEKILNNDSIAYGEFKTLKASLEYYDRCILLKKLI